MSPNSNRLNSAEIDRQVLAVQDIFRQVRERIVAAAGKTTHTTKSDDSPVTKVDQEVERIITDRMTAQFPGLAVYGEESGYEEGLSGTHWLVDPIDGTKSFIVDTPGYTIMAVLIQDEQAVASVVYDPRTDNMYSAQKGQGAFKNGQRLDLTKAPMPKTAFGRERLLGAINEILKPADVRCESGPTGAGYAFGMVADGQLAARFNFPHQPGGGHIHDYAPGALLVLEAGGAVISIEDDHYTYKTRSFVACHPQLEALVRSRANWLHEQELQTA